MSYPYPTVYIFVASGTNKKLYWIFSIILLKEMPPVDKRQTLLFSATFPDNIQSFAAKFLRKEYLFIKVGIVGGACSDVTQRLIQVESAEATKTHTLEELVKDVGENKQRTLVFVETKRKADFIACMLSQTQIATTSIHGDRFVPTYNYFCLI